MDVVGGVRIVDGSEAKVVSGLDDHSRFAVSARVVARATARPVCDASTYAMRVHGVPEQILTDNGKVFTARFGPGPGPVLFDRICNDNGVRHILTAPRSPTTTGKVERWHKTLRREFLDGKVFASIADAQAQLDGWVWHYNHERPHQSIGRVPPIERFQLAEPRDKPAKPFDEAKSAVVASGPVTTRRVSRRARSGSPPSSTRLGRGWPARPSRSCVRAASCRSTIAACWSRRTLAGIRSTSRPPASSGTGKPRPSRPSASSPSVTRKVDSSGNVCFAGANYRVGSSYRRRQVQVAVVGDTVEISIGEQLIRSHRAKHDRTREHGALANPGGRPHRSNAA